MCLMQHDIPIGIYICKPFSHNGVNHVYCSFIHIVSIHFPSPEKSPGNSATIGAAVGGVIGAMLVVVAVTAVIVVTVYCFMCARRKGSIDL